MRLSGANVGVDDEHAAPAVYLMLPLLFLTGGRVRAFGYENREWRMVEAVPMDDVLGPLQHILPLE